MTGRPTHEPAGSPRVFEALAPWVVAAVFLGLAVAGWGKWSDVLIDYGRELYGPWRLSQGATLYRDVASFNGPLASWLMGRIFGLFGPFCAVAFVADLALTAAAAVVVWRFFKGVSGLAGAFVASLVFVCFFGLAHFDELGNYAWAAPYSRDLTVGGLLALLLVLALASWLRTGKPSQAGLAGFLLGLCLLTKPEIAAAGTAAVFAAVIVGRPREPRGLWLGIAAGGLCCCLAFFGFSVFFAADFTFADWLGHVLWPYELVASGKVSKLDFYRRMTGLDAPLPHLWAIAREFFAVCALLGFVALMARARPPWGTRTVLTAGGAVLLLAAGLAVKASYPLIVSGGALPAAAVALAAYYGVASSRRVGHSERARRQGLFVWAVFSLAMLGKMLLAPSLSQYGFVLAMPAAVLLAVFVCCELPDIAAADGGQRQRMRALCLCIVCLDLVFAVTASLSCLTAKTYAVGLGRDTIRTYAAAKGLSVPGPVFQEALEAVARYVGPGQTLAVLPEGVTINFLARRASPVPYYSYLPPELAMFGEGNMAASLAQARPDFVLVTPRCLVEYGVRDFGQPSGLAEGIFQWVKDNYALVWRGAPMAYFGQNTFDLYALKK